MVYKLFFERFIGAISQQS